jgi:hypothetical protein
MEFEGKKGYGLLYIDILRQCLHIVYHMDQTTPKQAPVTGDEAKINAGYPTIQCFLDYIVVFLIN